MKARREELLLEAKASIFNELRSRARSAIQQISWEKLTSDPIQFHQMPIKKVDLYPLAWEVCLSDYDYPKDEYFREEAAYKMAAMILEKLQLHCIGYRHDRYLRAELVIGFIPPPKAVHE